MKIYFRILNYTPRLVSRLIQFFIYALLGVIFSAAYLVLVIPMLKVLFKEPKLVVPPIPDFEISSSFFSTLFNHYFIQVAVDHGRVGALLFVCVAIIFTMIVANIFKYAERMVASRMKVDVVKNMRMHIFRNVSLLHIGYFNNQRKGDLISRFTNDVAEVEGAVVNSLKSVFKEPITIIVYIIILFSISVKLTLFTLIV
ncbi:MAG TPA: ABC transporter transmembrane domain-containing protein, partial [Cyclobacteriaceae bacterium]